MTCYTGNMELKIHKFRGYTERDAKYIIVVIANTKGLAEHALIHRFGLIKLEEMKLEYIGEYNIIDRLVID